MNRLIEIWCQEGFPLSAASNDYASVLTPLQAQLNKIHEAFTGYDEAYEESDDEYFIELDDEYEDFFNNDYLEASPMDPYSRVIRDSRIDDERSYAAEERSYGTKDRFLSTENSATSDNFSDSSSPPSSKMFA